MVVRKVGKERLMTCIFGLEFENKRASGIPDVNARPA
jgi:hypothetical protein